MKSPGSSSTGLDFHYLLFPTLSFSLPFPPPPQVALCRLQKQKIIIISKRYGCDPLTSHCASNRKHVGGFWETTFPLKLPQGNGVEGAHFPSYTGQTHRLAFAKTAGPHQHANIFTDSWTTAGSVWERGGYWVWQETGFIYTGNFICTSCSSCFTEVTAPQKTSTWSQLRHKM